MLIKVLILCIVILSINYETSYRLLTFKAINEEDVFKLVSLILLSPKQNAD